MIREDYLIAWIKRYVRLLAEIAGFIKAQDFEAAARRADLALRELLNMGTDSVVSLTEGEILARLALGDPPPVVRDKCLMVAALLNSQGQVAVGKGNPDLGRDCWLKALQVVLGIQLREPGCEVPEFAPKVSELLDRLRGADLPARTEATLILYHERCGEFDLAENALFRLLEATEAADHAGVIDLGMSFYRRLSLLSDEALAAGNLSREEVGAGLKELLARQPVPGVEPDSRSHGV